LKYKLKTEAVSFGACRRYKLTSSGLGTEMDSYCCKFAPSRRSVSQGFIEFSWRRGRRTERNIPSARLYGLSRSRIARSKHPNSRPSAMPISAIPVSRAFERRGLRDPRIEPTIHDFLSALYVISRRRLMTLVFVRCFPNWELVLVKKNLIFKNVNKLEQTYLI